MPPLLPCERAGYALHMAGEAAAAEPRLQPKAPGGDRFASTSGRRPTALTGAVRFHCMPVPGAGPGRGEEGEGVGLGLPQEASVGGRGGACDLGQVRASSLGLRSPHLWNKPGKG